MRHLLYNVSQQDRRGAFIDRLEVIVKSEGGNSRGDKLSIWDKSQH